MRARWTLRVERDVEGAVTPAYRAMGLTLRRGCDDNRVSERSEATHLSLPELLAFVDGDSLDLLGAEGVLPGGHAVASLADHDQLVLDVRVVLGHGAVAELGADAALAVGTVKAAPEAKAVATPMAALCHALLNASEFLYVE